MFYLLIAESDDEAYAPVNVAGSIEEARGMASFHLGQIHDAIAKDRPEDGPCAFYPHAYAVWTTGTDGRYYRVAEFPLDAL